MAVDCDNINNVAKTDKTCENAGVAQLVEQLICNQQVGGSSPSTSSTCSLQESKLHMGGFPSGQREQTVNLSSMTSVVRIHHLPPVKKSTPDGVLFFFCVLVML